MKEEAGDIVVLQVWMNILLEFFMKEVAQTLYFKRLTFVPCSMLNNGAILIFQFVK